MMHGYDGRLCDTLTCLLRVDMVIVKVKREGKALKLSEQWCGSMVYMVYPTLHFLHCKEFLLYCVEGNSLGEYYIPNVL